MENRLSILTIHPPLLSPQDAYVGLSRPHFQTFGLMISLIFCKYEVSDLPSQTTRDRKCYVGRSMHFSSEVNQSQISFLHVKERVWKKKTHFLIEKETPFLIGALRWQLSPQVPQVALKVALESTSNFETYTYSTTKQGGEITNDPHWSELNRSDVTVWFSYG
jgi:hypothetical protein